VRTDVSKPWFRLAQCLAIPLVVSDCANRQSEVITVCSSRSLSGCTSSVNLVDDKTDISAPPRFSTP